MDYETLRGRLGGHLSAAARFRGRAAYHKIRGEQDLADKWERSARDQEREAAHVRKRMNELLGKEDYEEF